MKLSLKEILDTALLKWEFDVVDAGITHATRSPTLGELSWLKSVLPSTLAESRGAEVLCSLYPGGVPEIGHWPLARRLAFISAYLIYWADVLPSISGGDSGKTRPTGDNKDASDLVWSLVRIMCQRGIAANWQSALNMRADLAVTILASEPKPATEQTTDSDGWETMPDGTMRKGFTDLRQVAPYLKQAGVVAK